MSVAKALEDTREAVTDAEMILYAHKQYREALIIQAHAEGLSLRRVAELAGVSHQTVANVVAARAATTTSQPAPPSE